MSVQSQLDVNTTPFIISSFPSFASPLETLLKDASRTTVLASFTLMAQIAASGKWVPFIDITAVDGSGLPSGILLKSDIQGDVTAAELVAGDVVGVPILKFGAQFDEDKLVIENSLTLDTVLSPAILAFDAGTGDATSTLTTPGSKTIREVLLEKSLIAVDTETTSLPQT